MWAFTTFRYIQPNIVFSGVERDLHRNLNEIRRHRLLDLECFPGIDLQGPLFVESGCFKRQVNNTVLGRITENSPVIG
jgi:hypothetical protein